MNLERLEYGKPCVSLDGPVLQVGGIPSEHAELGRTSGFPVPDASAPRGFAWTPAAWGVREVVQPTLDVALVHAPFVLGAERRWAGITLAQRLRAETADGARHYWISRFAAQITGDPLSPSALFRAVTATPLVGLTREAAARVTPLPVPAGPLDTAWPLAQEAAAWIMSGVPVVVRVDEQGISAVQFLALADAVWAWLPPSVRPWFSWAWNIRRARTLDAEIPLAGRLAFVATDQRVPGAVSVDRTGTWTRPTEPPPGVRGEADLFAPGEGWWAHVGRARENGRAPYEIGPESVFGHRSLFALGAGPYHAGPVVLQGGGAAPPLRDVSGQRDATWARVDFSLPDLPRAFREIGLAAGWEGLALAYRDWLAHGTPDPWALPELRWPDDALGLGRVLDLAEDAWNDPYTCPRAFHLLAEVAARAAPTGLRAEAERRATHRGGRQVIPFDAFDLADAVVAGEAPRLVRAWAAIPSAAAASLLPPTDRATRLVTALRAAWDTLAWPWPRGGTGEVLTLLDTSAAHATGSAVFKAWVESAPARLAVLLAGAHTAEAPTGDLYARAGASTAGRVFRGSVGQATPSHIAGLPEPERAATVRFAAVLLLEKDALSRARDLGLDVRDSAAIRDWAWHVIVRVAAPGALVSLPDEAWLTLIRAHLLDALPPADDWLKPCLRRLGSDLPLPPTDLPDADPAIAAALLRMWPLVLDVRRAAHPESGAPNPDVARFVRRWPPGLPELLVGPPYVGEGLDGPLPLPSLPDSELKRIAENLSAQREDPANREAYAELFWLLLAHAPAPLGPTVATLNEGAFPPVLPDSGTRRLLREALSLLGPRHPVAALAATFRRGATQGGEQACVALALLPANVLGPIPPATIAALFTWYRAMPAGRVGIASELQVILADWPQARILVVEAGPFSVTRSSWHQEFARRPIALCFDGLDPAELPEAPLSSINRYFSGGGNFGVWAALLSALTGPMPPALEAELRGFTAGACTQPMHSGDYRSNIRVVGDPVAPEQIVAFLERNWRHLKRREGRFPHYAPDAWRDRGWWFVGVGTTGVGAAMVVTGFVEGALVTLAPSGSPDLRLAFRDIVLAGAPWAIVGLAVLVAGLMLLRHRSGEYQVVDVEDRRTGSDERRGQIRMSNAAIRYFDALEVHRRRHARSRARPPTRPDCRDHTD